MENNNENIDIQNNIDNQDVINSDIQQSPVEQNVVEAEIPSTDETITESVIEPVNNVIEEPSINENKENFISKLKNNRKLLFIIGGVLLAVVIAIVLLLVINSDGSNGSFKDPFKDFDTKGFDEISSSISSKNVKEIVYKEDYTDGGITDLNEDYKSEFITTDEYVLQLAYITFGDSKVTSKYKSNKKEINADVESLLKVVKDNIDKLEPETIAYIMQKAFLLNYRFDTEVKQTSKVYNNNLSIKSLADNKGKFDSTLYSLNKVTLSKNKHFLVYYATTGGNKVTDEYANRVADLFEYFVDKYKKMYGLDFKYDYLPNLTPDAAITETGYASNVYASALLAANKINEKNLLTAMPIYIIDTGTNIKGYSAGVPDLLVDNLMAQYGKFVQVCHLLFPDNTGICTGDAFNSAMTTAVTYSFPFIAVSSQLDMGSETDFTVGHELFHHYQKYICGDGKYKNCPAGLFTLETTANLSPILARELDGKDLGYTNILNTSHGKYRYYKDIEKSIDKVGISKAESSLGYGAYIYAYNYVKIVPNGLNIMKNSVKYENTLDYLYKEAGDKYKDVMITTAEKNITHNYSLKSLIVMDDYQQMVLPPAHHTFTIQSSDVTSSPVMEKSSIHYYYIDNVNQFTQKQQLTFSSNSKKLAILLFGKSGGKYNMLYKQDLNGDFKINLKDFKNYSDLAIAVVDYSNTGANVYTYEYKSVSEDEKDALDPKKIKNSVYDLIGVSEAELARAKAIYCKKSDPKSTSMRQISEVLVNYKNSNRIKDLYVKETLDASDLDKSSPAYNLAKSLMDVSFQGIEQLFNLYFKEAKTIYSKQDLKYTLTVKLPDEYFDNLGDVYNFEGNRKIDILTGLIEEGFTCYLEH